MRGRRRPVLWDVAVALTLAVTGFVINALLAREFSRLGVFEQYNVVFEADPNVYVETIGHGWGLFLFRHVNVIPFFNPPVRAAAIVLGLFSDAPAKDVRESLALLVVPAFGAAKTLFLYAGFRQLGFSRVTIALLCVLDIFSFSRLVFGSLPESFAASGAIIAALLWLALSPWPRPALARTGLWIVLTTVAVGVTITNVIAAVPLLVLDGWRRAEPVAHLVSRVALVLVAAAALHVTIALVMSRAYNADPPVFSFDPRTDTHIKNQPLTAAAQLTWVLPNTLLAPRPIVVPNSIKQPGLRYDYMFSYTYPGAIPVAQILTAAVVYLMVGLGARGLARLREHRPLLLASAGIVGANMLMHLSFGYEYFLYTQHWQVLLLVLVAGVMWRGAARAPGALIALVMFTALVVITSTSHVLWMLAVLRGG